MVWQVVGESANGLASLVRRIACPRFFALDSVCFVIAEQGFQFDVG